MVFDKDLTSADVRCAAINPTKHHAQPNTTQRKAHPTHVAFNHTVLSIEWRVDPLRFTGTDV